MLNRILKPFLNPENPSSKFPPLASHFSHSPILQGRQRDNDSGSTADEFNKDPDCPPSLFVVQPKLRPETLLKSKLEEALNLANSLEQQRHGFYATDFLDKQVPPHIVVQNPFQRSLRCDTYFGTGTVSTVKCHINNLESKDEVDAVFVNAILSGIQQRNLERHWGKPVLDRVSLIIEIFNAHAQTKEAKLQAELAALMYKRSRLVRVRGPGGRLTFGGIGESEVVSARGRGSGGQGFISGAGETELQLQRRRILDRKKKLLSEIKEVRRTRAVQRAARKSQGGSSGQATVAIVGYTNAGKSTLVSALSNTDLYCDDRLFATVDPKLRAVMLPSGREVLLSDTVGFISDLPVQLVEAFHATLEEVIEADLLVHVLDSSAPDIQEHRKAVMQVLNMIGVPEEKIQNMIEVWNKFDLEETKFDIVEANDDEDYVSSSSDEENVDSAFEHISFVENDQNLVAEPLECIEDEQVEESDSWLAFDDEECPWLSSETVGVQQNEVVSVAKGSESQCVKMADVKTSAITGVGLKELLQLIDEKLGTYQVVERKSVFDRKWRPPREEDNEKAIGE